MMIYELHFCKICLTTGAHNFRQSTYCIMRLKGMCFAKNVGSTFKENLADRTVCTVLYSGSGGGSSLVVAQGFCSHPLSLIFNLTPVAVRPLSF